MPVRGIAATMKSSGLGRSFRAWWRNVAQPGSWFGILLSVLAGTGAAYFLEIWLIGGTPTWSLRLLVFLAFTLTALGCLAYLTFRSIRQGLESGVFVHVALLPEEGWRARHENDQDGLRRWVDLNWPAASVLPSRITVAAPASASTKAASAGASHEPTPRLRSLEDQLHTAATRLSDTLAALPQLTPHAGGLNLLIGARADVAIQFGVQCANILPETFSMVADARDATSIDGYLRYSLSVPTEELVHEEGQTVVYLEFDAGVPGAASALAARLGASDVTVAIGALSTESEAYASAAHQIRQKLRTITTRQVLLAGNGPQGLLFVAGLTAARLGFDVSVVQFIGRSVSGNYGAVWKTPALPLAASPATQALDNQRRRTLSSLAEALIGVTIVLGTTALSLIAQWFLAQTHAGNIAQAYKWAGYATAACLAVGLALASISWLGRVNPSFVIKLSAGPRKRFRRAILAPERLQIGSNKSATIAWLKDRIDEIHSVAPATVILPIDLTGVPTSQRPDWDAIADELRIGTRTNVPLEYWRHNRKARLITAHDKLDDLWTDNPG